MRTDQRGFTLMELLVVIAIIGVLASIITIGLGTTRQNARDTKRASDMTQIQRALELFANENGGRYPDAPAANGRILVANMTSGGADITPYISAIPRDPTNTGNNGYWYGEGPNRQSYTLVVRLEKNSSWCSVNYEPGHAAWNYSNYNPSTGSGTYPPCDLK